MSTINLDSPDLFTYEKRLGIVNANLSTRDGGSLGIKKDGKYWCTVEGVIAIVPDQWDIKIFNSSGFPLESLPKKVKKAKSVCTREIINI
jgi:hypothetical protein